MLQVAAASGTALMAAKAQAQAALVNEKDAQAAALGYVADSTKVDAKKFPKHAAAQMCSNCQVYAGKPADPAGPCAIFPGKLVAGKGWCSAYVKKAG
ncbi:MAG: high-potential iron-sulfur protein [Hydrogenophaga sp.]